MSHPETDHSILEPSRPQRHIEGSQHMDCYIFDQIWGGVVFATGNAKVDVWYQHPTRVMPGHGKPRCNFHWLIVDSPTGWIHCFSQQICRLDDPLHGTPPTPNLICHVTGSANLVPFDLMKVGVWLNDPLNFPPSLSQRFQSILLLNKFQIPGLFHVQLGELTPQTLTTTKMISQSFLHHLSTVCLIYPQVLLPNIPWNPNFLMFKHPTPWFTVPPSLAGAKTAAPSLAISAIHGAGSLRDLRFAGAFAEANLARWVRQLPCLPSSHHHRFIGGIWWDGYCSYHSQSWVVYDIVLPTLVVWYFFFEFAIEKWPSYFVDLPIKDGDFPVCYVKLLEDTFSDGRIPSEEKNPGRYSSPAWRPLTTVLYVCSQEP